MDNSFHGGVLILDRRSESPVAGSTGSGYVLLTIGLILLVVSLGRRVFARGAVGIGA
ncbi:hypothetical protein ACPPVW_11645 [Leifsonia sp. McL0607]|uniref:hypothetical protein n=1 Tax=Leifsonia sp. McL0607 TaxID=3415672 RepID=UPI003CF82A59